MVCGYDDFKIPLVIPIDELDQSTFLQFQVLLQNRFIQMRLYAKRVSRFNIIFSDTLAIRQKRGKLRIMGGGLMK